MEKKSFRLLKFQLSNNNIYLIFALREYSRNAFFYFMNKLILFLLLFLYTNQIFSQNLVPNPSFEGYSDCPNDGSQLYKSIPWFETFRPGKSSDFYNKCDTTYPAISSFWEVQHPRTGNGMAGIILFNPNNLPNNENREFLEVRLSQTLIANKTYCVSYYILLFKYAPFAIDSFCSCFSQDSILSDYDQYNIPSCSNFSFNPTQTIISDTLNWTKISYFQTATGGEEFLTIGNFKTVNLTNSDSISGSLFWIGAYYFVDDVAVYECDAPTYPAYVPDRTLCYGETTTIGNASRPQYYYEWYNSKNQVVSNQSTYTFVADSSTYFILKQKDFKFDETIDTVFITVNPCNLIIPNVITPNNDGINDFFVIDGGSELTVDLQLFNRWGKLVYHSKRYQNNWPVNDIADGVYFYVIKATSANGEVREYQGSVSVLR